ncbi:MAG: adenosine deaminase [Bacteroidota bacterium]
MDSNDFIQGLYENSIELVMKSPKSDLHNHAALGSRLEYLEEWAQQSVAKPPAIMKDLGAMDRYLADNLINLLMTEKGFEYAMNAAFKQARADGIQVLQMSFDLRFFMKGIRHIEALTGIINQCKNEFAPEIHFIPQLGIDRTLNISAVTGPAEECIGSGFFKSIDLYGEELVRTPEYFTSIYNTARKAGLKLTAHAGEFGNAELVRHTVEVLGIEEVQHGISVAESQEVMNWVRENNIQLNICPTSNVKLSRVASIAEHPIRRIFDHGIKVTVNTDDLMIFGQSVSDEFFNLYKSGLFSPEELDIIRMNGLT